MSDEQQHEGGRKPQPSHASKSHAPKSGHVADSWRELAEDARQWVDGHRLAVVATTVLVVLNLVVWLVAAMAGFAFPLRRVRSRQTGVLVVPGARRDPAHH